MFRRLFETKKSVCNRYNLFRVTNKDYGTLRTKDISRMSKSRAKVSEKPYHFHFNFSARLRAFLSFDSSCTPWKIIKFNILETFKKLNIELESNCSINIDAAYKQILKK